MREGLARWIVRIAAFVVPRGRRAEWLDEWRAELHALSRARAGPAGASGRPGPLAFALGAVPHALWIRREGWTMDGVLQDLRYSVRVLARAPGYTLATALILALGIGANASIFSLVNGLMLRAPAGIREPERLVQIARSYETDPRWDNFSWPALRLIEREARTLSGVAGYMDGAFVLGRGADAEQLPGQFVSGGYFDVLGVRPRVGRLIQPAADVRPGAHPVVVLSHGLWRRRFGSDPGIVGRTVSIGARPYTVVGVAPERFAGAESLGPPPALWVPAMQHPGFDGSLPFDEWGWSWIDLVGRLADGVTFDEARASMEVVSARLREAAPVNEGILALLAPGVGLDPGERLEARRLSRLLLAIVGLVLLLTCANVANLSLARVSGRRRELCVRTALGAGRGRIARQVVSEAVVVALAATVLALPIVLAAGRFLPLVFPYALAVPVGADGRVLAFLAAVGVSAGVLFGAVPAWAAARGAAGDALKEGATGEGPRGSRTRDALVAAQLALSLGLVAGAALLGRSVLNARAAHPGFEPDGLTVAFVDLGPTGRYDEEAGRALFDRLVRAAGEIPGVSGATLANQAPVVGGHSRATVRPQDRHDVNYEAEFVVVGPRYFETLGVDLVAGRALGGLDEELEPVVVVNEALADLFWPEAPAFDQEIEGSGTTWRVVGVSRGVRMRSLRASGRPAVYYPLAHAYSSRMILHLRGASGSPPSAAEVREVVAAIDPELPVAGVAPLRDGLTASLAETRTIGYLMAAFALLAVALAAVGLYGLVSYGASRRVREMGIRVALGAEPASLVRLVAGRGAAVAALGVLGGLGVSHAVGRALRGILFEVGAADAPTLGVAAGVLALTAVVASWVPARRASRVDAAEALRRV